MRPRQSLIEIFSTFVQFEAERLSGWASDAKLQRSMRSCLAQAAQSENSEDFWVLYWYKGWQTQMSRLAREHLSAYLQEVCYWVAQKTAVRFSSEQYTISDCFQMAIAQFDKVLKGFDLNQGFSLKSYATTVFRNLLAENLRQRHEVAICTDWALLRKVSQKQLVESLQNTGLSPETVTCYLLAWNCFKLIYVPTQAGVTRKLPKPDRATWEAIAALYNKERLGQLPSPREGTPEALEKWITSCAQAARTYLYPTLTSINAPRTGQESGELLDNLPQLQQESILTELITQEEVQHRAEQQTQINTVLVAALAQLDAQSQRLLQMYYSEELTQQEMAKQLDIKQYTVSRRLTKARELLLLALAKWSQETLHISLNSDLLKSTSIVLEEWLNVYYSQPNLLFRT